ncbi:MAG TPA: CDF family Co(II)/Ni(II) efflux transporter DmeF [Hypericibacter adhaerens]|jgi:cation diffusion facilitator family transporter|uniref:CDF family Co(II)/Ni(II) efflux transporter DmeF n=1 Tax=Hypericibacter adhaerens TaxID=2602016 RepID=UPI002BD400FA|nr:CDF family Co(II)/Ni(II) efflux transporter DmeF [Hypericibacter adhaerens]HWA45171.1 CDF family Co(II)/Ni(II) efflux transporter DmeF [Hypericibacter adhaerens]
MPHAAHSFDRWQHNHFYLADRHDRRAKRVWIAVWLTAAMMIAEIVAGYVFGSMALLADGWHMATHAGALGMAGLAYRYAARHARNSFFSFGTGKIGDLAAFTNAIILMFVAGFILWESAARLLAPRPIAYDEALGVAVAGLLVNLVCAGLLHEKPSGAAAASTEAAHSHTHDHGHDHAHEPGHGHGHHRDHNLHGAYLHVIADAATSVLAIVGLLAGRLWNWAWMDPAVGVVGAVVIARWSLGLARSSSAVLLDAVPDRELEQRIRARLESDADRVTDLHLWRLGPGHFAAMASVVSTAPQTPAQYKARLEDLPSLSHVTVEVEPCEICAKPAH